MGHFQPYIFKYFFPTPFSPPSFWYFHYMHVDMFSDISHFSETVHFDFFLLRIHYLYWSTFKSNLFCNSNILLNSFNELLILVIVVFTSWIALKNKTSKKRSVPLFVVPFYEPLLLYLPLIFKKWFILVLWSIFLPGPTSGQKLTPQR